jgi:hypothetical protein
VGNPTIIATTQAYVGRLAESTLRLDGLWKSNGRWRAGARDCEDPVTRHGKLGGLIEGNYQLPEPIPPVGLQPEFRGLYWLLF